MDKITQALKKVLPAEHVAEVVKAVEDIVAEEVNRLESDFQRNLDKAYEQLAEEMKLAETVCEQGYKQAYEIVASLMNRIDEQRSEFEDALEEGFEEAYQELQVAKSSKNDVETEIYDEFNKKLQEMKDLMIDKVDQFLSLQEAEIYESAKRDVLSDPRVVEQRVAVEKMAEILSDYISADDFAGVASSKLEEASQQIESLRGQLRIVEAKSVRLAAQNGKLHEQVADAHNVITEATKVERRERAGKSRIASGRGQRVVQEQLISEYAAPTKKSNSNSRDLQEANDPLNDLLVLSGLELS